MRGATWGEIDLTGREWRIPAERMKMGRAHRVPLSDAALTLLRAVEPSRYGASDLIFQSATKPGRPLSDLTLSRLMRTCQIDAVPHGFRSSFRDWASEQTAVPHAVAEQSLAHQVGSAVERSYARSDLFDQRRGLMSAWAAFVAPTYTC